MADPCYAPHCISFAGHSDPERTQVPPQHFERQPLESWKPMDERAQEVGVGAEAIELAEPMVQTPPSPSPAWRELVVPLERGSWQMTGEPFEWISRRRLKEYPEPVEGRVAPARQPRLL